MYSGLIVMNSAINVFAYRKQIYISTVYKKGAIVRAEVITTVTQTNDLR